MKKLIFCIAFVLSCFAANAQVALRVTIPSYGLRLDSVPFEIIRVVDNTKDARYCGYFESRSGRQSPYYLKGGIAKRFETYFKKADKGARLGNKKLVAAFNNLHVVIKNEKGKKGVQVNQEMDIDFYELIDDGSLKKIMNYHETRDTSITNMDFNLKKSTYPMMQEVYQKLTSYYKVQSELNKEEDAFVKQVVSQNQEIKGQNTQTLQSLSQIPETRRINFNIDLIGYEQFYSSKLRGYRARYGIAFKSDSSKWIPMGSFDFELLDLKEQFDGSNGVYDVLLSYFGIGFGSIRRFDEALGVELNAKFIFGSEQISQDPFLVDYSSSTIFGLHMIERLHIFIGKEAGIVMTAGFYQNFNGGSKYVPTDIGYLWGLGIHF